MKEVTVNMADLDPIDVTIHVHGLAMFRARMFVVKILLFTINIIAPKNVNFHLCSECRNEGNDDASKDSNDTVWS